GAAVGGEVGLVGGYRQAADQRAARQVEHPGGGLAARRQTAPIPRGGEAAHLLGDGVLGGRSWPQAAVGGRDLHERALGGDRRQRGPVSGGVDHEGVMGGQRPERLAAGGVV